MSLSDESRRSHSEVRDEALAALYRQAAREEPSPRHNAAILAAAAADLAESQAPRRQPWWLRWRTGLSLAVTVVLSAGLVLLVEREQRRESATPAREDAAPARSAITPTPPASPERSAPAEGRLAAPAPAPFPGRADHAPGRGPMEAPPKHQDAGRAAAPAAKARSEEKVDVPPRPAAAPPPAEAAPAPSPPAAPVLRQESREANAPGPREADSAALPDELAEVRALLRAGRKEEARTALAAYLRRHPDFALPADLEALRPRPE